MNHNYVGADPYRWPYDGDLQHGVDSDSLTAIRSVVRQSQEYKRVHSKRDRRASKKAMNVERCEVSEGNQMSALGQRILC
jgi:hypothetical protein